MNNPDNSGLKILIIPNCDISHDLDQAIRDGLVKCYPKDREHFSQKRAWHSTPEWIVCAITGDGLVAAHMAIIERRITVGQASTHIKIAGPQGVFVRPQWRKTGLSDRIMECAMTESKRRGIDAGLLFCRPELDKKVYGRMGWIKVDVDIIMENGSGETVPYPGKDIAMVYALSIQTFPTGNINLCGQDW